MIFYLFSLILGSHGAKFFFQDLVNARFAKIKYNFIDLKYLNLQILLKLKLKQIFSFFFLSNQRLKWRSGQCVYYMGHHVKKATVSWWRVWLLPGFNDGLLWWYQNFLDKGFLMRWRVMMFILRFGSNHQLFFSFFSHLFSLISSVFMTDLFQNSKVTYQFFFTSS